MMWFPFSQRLDAPGNAGALAQPRRIGIALSLLTLTLGAFVFTVATLHPATYASVTGIAGIAQAKSSLIVRGRRLRCGGGLGKDMSSLPVMGTAIPSRKVFFINTRLMRRYPASFSHFVYLHECAHMYTYSESEADCWAIKRGLYRGLFNRSSIDQICKALWSTPAGLYHNAGPSRCEQLKQCYVKATRQR